MLEINFSLFYISIFYILCSCLGTNIQNDLVSELGEAGEQTRKVSLAAAAAEISMQSARAGPG